MSKIIDPTISKTLELGSAKTSDPKKGLVCSTFSCHLLSPSCGLIHPCPLRRPDSTLVSSHKKSHQERRWLKGYDARNSMFFYKNILSAGPSLYHWLAPSSPSSKVMLLPSVKTQFTETSYKLWQTYYMYINQNRLHTITRCKKCPHLQYLQLSLEHLFFST